MIVPNKERYRHHIPRIISFLDKNKDQDPIDLIGIISVFTGCPIIIVCHYMEEIKGSSPRLLNKINNLKIFYNYEM